MKRKILIPLLLVSLVLGFAAIHIANAQTASPGIDLTVSPPVIELNAKPGDIIKERFRLRNNQSTPINLGIDVKKLSSDSTSGEPVPAEPTKDDDFISWLTVNPSSVTVLPKEWTDVNFELTIPENAAYGYYYVLRVHPTQKENVKGSGATVQGQVLVVVLLNVVKEGAKAKAGLVSFTPSIFVSEYVPVTFTAKVSNTGNVHVKPAGNIFIRSFHQKDIAILDINGGHQAVLPGGTRTFTSTWDDGFIVREPVVENGLPKLDKNGKQVTKITINWDRLTHFRIGPYTATLLMVYDDGKRDATIEGTATFWLIPYTAIIIILISLIVLIIIIRFLLRWYIRRELRKQRNR
jgi:hypothetical protein